jgi:putative hydrolase of HD superfamily
MSNLSDLARFFNRVQALKRVPRSGWIDRGVPLPEVESVADHTWQTALIAWLTAVDGTTLDANRVLQLAMIHDLAEVIVGDQPPYAAEDVPDPTDRAALEAFFSRRHVRSAEAKAMKREDEHAAFADLIADLSPTVRTLLSDLWEEYETQATPEARFVKQADTLEAYLQSRHYAAVDPTLPVDGFRQMADLELTQPEMVAIRDAVREP